MSVVDRNFSSWECFDVSTASTLFWKQVPFIYKTAEREDVREKFTVRILTGLTKTNHNLKVLRIHISTEADLLFLHTLEVTEDDFQSLKADQGILVDFSHFPEKLITLLEKCIQSCNEEFQAELTTIGAESCLRIVETNDFNKLPHVTLKFRPGSDHSVKSFLAFRLSEVDQESRRRQQQLNQSHLECERLKEALNRKEESWNELKEKYSAARLEEKAESKRIHLEAEERITSEKESLKSLFHKEKKELEEKLKAQIESLMQRNEELENENRNLKDDKYTLDKKCSELCHRLANAEGQASCLEKDCEDFRESNKRLTADKQKLQLDLSHSQAEVKTLTEKVYSIEQFVELQKNRISDLDHAKAHLERICEELRSTTMSYEKSGSDTAAELKEAKFVIQKLARDLHMAKEKQCNIRAILSRQEDVVSYQQRQLKEVTEEKTTLEGNFHELQRENGHLKSEMERIRNKLKESADQLTDHEKMIAWLHRQVNDSTLHNRKFYSTRAFPAHTRPHRDPNLGSETKDHSSHLRPS